MDKYLPYWEPMSSKSNSFFFATLADRWRPADVCSLLHIVLFLRAGYSDGVLAFRSLVDKVCKGCLKGLNRIDGQVTSARSTGLCR